MKTIGLRMALRVIRKLSAVSNQLSANAKEEAGPSLRSG
jgi:hypothetical protein